MGNGPSPEELFRMWREAQARPAPAPIDPDPARYPRAVVIEDDEALLLEARYQLKIRECEQLRADLDLAEAEKAADKARLFRRLERCYATVKGNAGGGTGFRHFDGRLYYVGWDEAGVGEASPPDPSSEPR